jgi:L-ascorbate metabolism protein UlaG (beta-lactamase superfamily)
MKLTWPGHSCFRLEKDGFVVVIEHETASNHQAPRPGP